MGRIFPHLRRLCTDDAGAVTIDWVVVTAAIVLVGISTVYAVYNSGVDPLVRDTGTRAVAALAIDPGDPPDLTPGS